MRLARLILDSLALLTGFGAWKYSGFLIWHKRMLNIDQKNKLPNTVSEMAGLVLIKSFITETNKQKNTHDQQQTHTTSSKD